MSLSHSKHSNIQNTTEQKLVGQLFRNFCDQREERGFVAKITRKVTLSSSCSSEASMQRKWDSFRKGAVKRKKTDVTHVSSRNRATSASVFMSLYRLITVVNMALRTRLIIEQIACGVFCMLFFCSSDLLFGYFLVISPSWQCDYTFAWARFTVPLTPPIFFFTLNHNKLKKYYDIMIQ